MNRIISHSSLTLVLMLTFPSLLISQQASAEIYKCVKKSSGEVFYKDKPCPVVDKETKMEAVKDPKNGYFPPKFISKEADNSGFNEESGGKDSSTTKNKKEKADTEDVSSTESNNQYKSGSSRSTPIMVAIKGAGSNNGAVESTSRTGRLKSKKMPHRSSKSLPRVELKVELGAKEPRGKLN